MDWVRPDPLGDGGLNIVAYALAQKTLMIYSIGIIISTVFDLADYSTIIKQILVGSR